MMIPITEQYLLRNIPPHIFIRGQDYYNKNRVHNIRLDKNIVKALVSGGELYEVYIEFYDEGIKSYYCDCPYSLTICKHVTAVLLKLLRDGVREDIDPIEGLQKAASKIELQEKHYPLIQKGRISQKDREVLSIFNKNLNQNTELPESKKNIKYKLAFLLSEDDFNEGLFLEPKLVYIKKNGEFGRFVNYSPKIDFPKPSETEQALLGLALASGRYFLDFVDVFPFIQRQGNLLLLNQEKKQINFYEFPFLQIRFSVLRMEKEQILFFPVFTLEMDNKFIVLERRGLFLNEEYAMTFDSKSSYLYFTKNREIIFLLKQFRGKDSFNIAEINLLKDHLNSNESLPVEINFNFKKLRNISLMPRIILDIDDHGKKIALTVKFLYEKRVISYDDDYLGFSDVDPDDPETYLLYNRAKNYEQEVVQHLHQYFAPYDDYGYFHINNDQFFLDIDLPKLLLECAPPLMDQGIDFRLEQKSLKSGAKLGSHYKSGIDWFQMELYLDQDGEQLSLQIDDELLEKGFIQSKKKYFYLDKEQIEFLRQLQKQGLSKKGKLEASKYNSSLLDLLHKNKELDKQEHKDLKKSRQVLKKLHNFSGISKVDKSPDFKGKLRSYQQFGFEWAHFLFEYNLNGILADDMGLGKTVQALALLDLLFYQKKIKKVLIAAPVVTIRNWENEIAKFTPQLKVLVHLGTQRESELSAFSDFDIIISSYSTLRNDISLLAQIQYDYFILDESHYIKNSKSQTHKAMLEIEAAHKLCLTGTPIENNLLELWAQFNFLNPFLLGKQNQYKQKYLKEEDTEALEDLQQIISPFILRRKKEDVLKDLPPKEEIIQYLDMGPAQQEIYEKQRDICVGLLNQTIDEKGKDKSSLIILQLMLKLRQIALFPGLVDEELEQIESCKMEYLKDLLDEILSENHKVLIFSQFEKVLLRIQDYLKKSKIGFSFISGKVKNREEEIRRFKEDSKTNVFLITLKAGGVGINLTEADYVIIFDPWWNPAAENQAIDRCYRIKQKNKVFAYKLIVKDSIEEKILELQQKKKELSNTLIKDEGVFKSLDRDELAKLFS